MSANAIALTRTLSSSNVISVNQNNMSHKFHSSSPKQFLNSLKLDFKNPNTVKADAEVYWHGLNFPERKQ